jgi:hypothetical protein
LKRILTRDRIDFEIGMFIFLIKVFVLLLGENFEVQFLAIFWNMLKWDLIDVEIDFVIVLIQVFVLFLAP